MWRIFGVILRTMNGSKYAPQDTSDLLDFFKNKSDLTQCFTYKDTSSLQKILPKDNDLTIIYISTFHQAYKATFEGIKNLKGEKLLLVNLQQNEIKNKTDDISKYIKENLTDDSKTTVILSNQSYEKAQESDMWKNSAFTEAILQGLKDGLADGYNTDNQQDNIITINELFEYLSETLPQLARESKADNLQHPVLLNNVLGDLGIHIIH